jgi:tetratricopeptide (TPR) repeat protein
MAESKKSPWDKGQRLAELFAKEKTLLVLDGMEPLQSGQEFEKGKIKDAALEVMLRGLAKKNPGLCVVTTRLKVRELEDKRYKETVESVDLEMISREAGRALLRVRNVRGTDAELEEVVEAFGCHALAVNLLGEYLHGIERHEIKHVADIPDLPEVEVDDGKHPRRVIEVISQGFGDGAEVEVLKVLGMFDRPVDMGAFEAVCGDGAIEGLTDRLHKMKPHQREKVFEKLRDSRLIAKKSKHNPNVLDCHPLVREHFGEKLEEGNKKAWRAGHERLYEYYKALPEKERPDTLEEMEPLFRAVYHGCQAGREQETLDEVYAERISRGDKHYSVNKLGAFGLVLGAVACFFERCWDRPAGGLTDEYKALVLNFAGSFLRAVGRLREATEPMGAGLELRIKQKKWENAAIAGSGLSGLWLVMGEIGKAVDYGRESVEYADRGGDGFQRECRRATWADALHQAGDIEGAERLFWKAEGMQKERHPEYEYLFSLRGYHFCDLLIGQGRYGEAKKRANKMLEWATQENWLLDIALDNLSLGLAHLLEYQKLKIKNKKNNDKGDKALAEAKKRLEGAVAGLREAGAQEFIVYGLLARAELYRVKGEYGKAEADLAEALEIAERGEMGLHLADCGLEGCRLGLAQGDRPRARDELAEAEGLIEKMGYHRRDGEVAELRDLLQEATPGVEPGAK